MQNRILYHTDVTAVVRDICLGLLETFVWDCLTYSDFCWEEITCAIN